MKKRIVVKILALTLCVIFMLTLFACVNDEDNRENIVKPDISTALNNYHELTKKHSNFDASIGFYIYRMTGTGNNRALTSAKIVEKLQLKRTVNDEKIYIDGSLKTDTADEQLVSMYKYIQKLVRPGDNHANDPIIQYLEGKTRFDAKLGYFEDCYNLKTCYVEENVQPSVFWGASTNQTVDNLIKHFNLDLDISINEYLMTSGLLDLSSASEWMSGDKASKYFSTASNKFVYNLIADSQKIYEILFDYVNKIAAAFGAEEYVDDLAKFNQVLPYLKKWFSVGPSTLDALVGENGLPDKMATSMQVDLNINLTDLEQVLAILMPDDKVQLMNLINLAYIGLGLRGTKGEENTIGLSLNFLLEENFLYDDSSCSLDDVDADLFLPIDVENPNRELFLFDPEKKPAEPGEG